MMLKEIRPVESITNPDTIATIPMVVIPKLPKYVPRRMNNVRNTTSLSREDTPKYTILSREGEGKDILFNLGYHDEHNNVQKVKECPFSDIHNFVSLEHLNDFENRLYEAEYQEELVLEQNVKKRGRPVLISTGTEPPGIIKVKGPRGRPRKTPLEPPPVEAVDDTATSDGGTDDTSSGTSRSEEISADDESDSHAVVHMVSMSVELLKRKRPQVELPMISTSNTIPEIANMNAPLSNISVTKSTSAKLSPDEPTEWEKSMMKRFGVDQPARGALKPSRGRPRGSTARPKLGHPMKVASVPRKPAPMSPSMAMRPKVTLSTNGVAHNRSEMSAMESSPSDSEDELASSPAAPSAPLPQHVHSSGVHKGTEALDDAFDDSSHSESESSEAHSSNVEIISSPRPPGMKYGEAILAARKGSMPPLVGRSRTAELSRSRPSASPVPVSDRKREAILDISQLDAGQAGVGVPSVPTAKSSTIAKKTTSVGIMTKKRRTSTTPLFPAAASPPRRRVLEVRDVRS